MPGRRSACLAIAMLLARPHPARAAGAETLRAGGTGGANGLLLHLGRAFQARQGADEPGITVGTVPRLGSGGGPEGRLALRGAGCLPGSAEPPP